MLTMAFIAFIISCFKVLVSGLTIKGFTFGVADPLLLGTILTPTLGAYITRRYTDSRTPPPPPPPSDWDAAEKKQG